MFTGPCCNLESCSVKERYTSCRPIKDDECDLEETCDGSSEWCPLDTYKKDGTPCMNSGDAYCYDGKCNSHDSQCHLIWGVDKAKKAVDKCYQKYNNQS